MVKHPNIKFDPGVINWIFGYSQDAIKEFKRAQTVEGIEIVPTSVSEILNFEKTVID